MFCPRLLVALLVILGACGPGVPDGGAGTGSSSGTDGGGAPTTTGAATTTDAVTTMTTMMTTDATSTGGATLPDTTDVTSTGADPTTGTAGEATTELGPCVADPAMGICTAACDAWSDCCACEGTDFVLDPRAPSCELPMGIVAAQCPWHPYEVLADGVALPAGCEDANGWTQAEHDGDLWIVLCDDTCQQFLTGEIVELEALMFCEAA